MPLDIFKKELSLKEGGFHALVYVCSPLAGDVARNMERARYYSRFVLERGRIPLAPHLLYPQFMDEAVPEERAIGLHIGLKLLDRCDALWYFGETISPGMAAEIEAARRYCMLVRHFTEDGLEVPV